MTDSFLLYKDSSTEGKKPYFSKYDIIKDLNLDIIFRTMSRGDVLVSENINKIMMLPLKTPEEVIYRQEIIRDFYKNQDLLEEIYGCVLKQQKALATYKEETDKNRSRQARKASQIIETLNYLGSGQDGLLFICQLLEKYNGKLESEGLQGLYKRLCCLPLEEIKKKLEDMDFFISGGEIGYTFQFGGGLKIDNASVNYCHAKQRIQKKQKQGGFKKLYNKYVKKNSVQINNNEELQKDVEYLEEFTLQHILKIFQPYLSEVMLFYSHFTEEIAFYMGVINFMKRMEELYITLVMPEPHQTGTKDTEFRNLYELSMAVYMQKKPVGNDAAKPHSLFLLNESFASTTEKEGSQIAGGILHAFYDKEITTIMVTHLFQLARSLYNKKLEYAAFLVAERKEDGARTFRMVQGEPAYTSYGTDLFKVLEDNI